VASITPTFQFWRANSRPDTKTCVITPSSTNSVSVLGIEPSNDSFYWAIGSRRGRQELRICPRTTERNGRTTFRITLRSGNEIVTQSVYAYIK
jgi:hypothetical protein